LNNLKQYGVDIKGKTIEIKFFPIPHFYIKYLKINISGDVTLELFDTSLNLDLLQLLTFRSEKVRNIRIRYSALHVLEQKAKPGARRPAATAAGSIQHCHDGIINQ